VQHDVIAVTPWSFSCRKDGDVSSATDIMRRVTATLPRAGQQVAPQFAITGGLCTVGGAFTYSGARVEDAARHTADAFQHSVVAIVVMKGW
jgi:hypothetical protein